MINLHLAWPGAVRHIAATRRPTPESSEQSRCELQQHDGDARGALALQIFLHYQHRRWGLIAPNDAVNLGQASRRACKDILEQPNYWRFWLALALQADVMWLEQGIKHSAAKNLVAQAEAKTIDWRHMYLDIHRPGVFETIFTDKANVSTTGLMLTLSLRNLTAEADEWAKAHMFAAAARKHCAAGTRLLMLGLGIGLLAASLAQYLAAASRFFGAPVGPLQSDGKATRFFYESHAASVALRLQPYGMTRPDHVHKGVVLEAATLLGTLLLSLGPIGCAIVHHLQDGKRARNMQQKTLALAALDTLIATVHPSGYRNPVSNRMDAQMRRLDPSYRWSTYGGFAHDDATFAGPGLDSGMLEGP